MATPAVVASWGREMSGRHRWIGVALGSALLVPGLTSLPHTASAVGHRTVSIGSGAIVEGDAGTLSFALPVTLSDPATTTVTVAYAVTSVTATARTDFLAKSGTLRFVPNTKTHRTPVERFVIVAVVGDKVREQAETFRVTLSRPTGGYVIGTQVGTAFILDNGPTKGVRANIGSTVIYEGNTGSKRVARVPVTLSAAPASTVAVNWTITGGTAVAGTDFTAKPSGTLTFPPKQQSAEIPVGVMPDVHAEPVRTIRFTLSRPTGGATVGRSQGFVAMRDGNGPNPPVATTTTRPVVTTTTTTVPKTAGVCGNPGSATLHQKVVVFAFENRTWSGVGGSQFQSLPYLNSLAKQCSTFSDYTEPDTTQNSATQYVGTDSGSIANTVVNDCTPGPSCDSTQDNIFRQVRRAGLVPRSFVEGATTGCSAGGNAAKHVGALYFFGTYTDASGTHNDNEFCDREVRPYSEFDPNNLADFSFVTPTLCNDGHDCDNSTVDAWAAANIQPILDSAAYKAGQVTVFIWYDEDHPVPNMQIGRSAHSGVNTTPIDYGSTLRAWEDLLGLPHIAHAISAVDMRPLANI